jgi:predicted AlkP superfamily pyrophosphatase or phosphodiesterase
MIDACLGIAGLPQSATGQATLLTGINVPAQIGYHYGPKPNKAVAEFLTNGNLFLKLSEGGKKAALLNAYPPRYFEAIQSGRRLYSAIPLAVTSANIQLKTQADMLAGSAISADFTAQGWHDHLGMPEIPLLSPLQAGERLVNLADSYHLAFFECWMTDYAGHRQDMTQACALLDLIDQVIGGLLESWNNDDGLIILISDHGNLEDLSTRRHTYNPVPLLLIGDQELRRRFISSLNSPRANPAMLDLTCIYRGIISLLLNS